jgi:beta-N-acetylhexosaminidase
VANQRIKYLLDSVLGSQLAQRALTTWRTRAIALCGLTSLIVTACGSAGKTTSDRARTIPSRPTSVAQPVHKSKPVTQPPDSYLPSSRTPPSIARMIGQTIIARFAGPSPSASFLARIREGQVGGVILFSDNVTGGEAATRQLIGRLQQTAADGGSPPLLIMIDQEGGEVKRLYWAPPSLAPRDMTSSAVARREGEATGKALRSVGVNVDLAPVADVERVPGSFLGARSFGSDPALVASRACQFAEGLAGQDVAFTLKHFPGLGRALTSTDVQPTTIEASASGLREDYGPYRECGVSEDALVMISSAMYPNLAGSSQPAVLSSEIYRQELPLATGGTPVTISDDVQAAALQGESAPAQRAINAGLDLVLYAQTEGGSADAFHRLQEVAHSGGISRNRLEEADQAIQSLKELVAGAPPAESLEGNTPYPENVGPPETIQPEGQRAVQTTVQPEK